MVALVIYNTVLALLSYFDFYAGIAYVTEGWWSWNKPNSSI